MNTPAELPLWAAILIAIFILTGATLTLLGSFGLTRMKSFYARVHAPTLGSTLGIGCILIASIVFFSMTRTRPAVHEIIIAVFITVTTPVTLLLLVRAALHRDRAKGSPEVPGAITFVNGTIRLIGDKATVVSTDEDNRKVANEE